MDVAFLPAASISQMLTAISKDLTGVGGGLLMILGVIAIVVAAYKTFKKLTEGERNQDKWPTIIILAVVGGVFLVGGFTFLANLANTLGGTAHGWSNGVTGDDGDYGSYNWTPQGQGTVLALGPAAQAAAAALLF